MSYKEKNNNSQRPRGAGRTGNNSRRNDEPQEIIATGGMIAELPVLTWNGNKSNYAEFKERMSTYLQQRYGNNGNFIDNDEYYVPPEPTEPEADDSQYAPRRDRVLWALWESEMKSRTKLMNNNLEQRTQIYQTIWGQLSVDSKEKVRQNANYSSAESDENGRPDPLELWRIIARTHLVRSTGNIILDRIEAKTTYDRIRQGFNESLGDFKLRFDRALEALKQLGYTQIPIENEQVIHFIKALHDSRYYEWKTKMINDVAAGFEIPENVVEAYEACSNYKPLYSEYVAAARGTAFITHGKGKKIKRQYQGHGQVYKQNKTHKDTPEKKARVNEEVKPDTDSNNNGNHCFKCGSTDHYANNCTFTGNCNKCGKPGHKAKVCRSKTTALTRKVLITESQCDNVMYQVHIDNQSNENVFCNIDLLDNVREAPEPIYIQGITGEEISCDKIGDFIGFTVYYTEHATANILSWSKLSEKMKLSWNQKDNKFTATSDDGNIYEFTCTDGGLYTCNFSNMNKQVFLTTTVSDNLADYSRREVKAADEARKLSRILGYASPNEMQRMIRAGTLINNSVTTADLARAEQIYGKDIAALKGKTTRKPSMQAGESEKIVGLVRKDQNLYMDIMFVDGLPFFISKAQPLGLIQVTDLKGRRHSTVILKAFQEHYDNLNDKGYKIMNVYTDGESGIDTIRNYIQRVANYNPAGPEQHVPVIERTIRTVKERTRSVLCGLPYTLPSSLLGHLLSYVVRCINIIPSQHSEDNLSAREKYLGRKTDVKKDLRIEFGSYVQAKVPNPTKINNMEERTEGCIALMPLDTVTGTVKFLNLTTLREVNRDQWVELPIPDIVLARLNEMAMKQSRKLSKDPTFSRGVDGEQDLTHNEVDEHHDKSYTEELMNIAYSDRTSTENIVQDDSNVVIHDADIQPNTEINGDGTIVEDHRGADNDGADSDLPIEINQLPDIQYQLDEDGDVIMDDSETIFHKYREDNDERQDATETIIDQSEIVDKDKDKIPTHPYSLRQHRTNWRNKVFRTAVSTIKDTDKHKYIYQTTITQCIDKLGKEVTYDAVRKELAQMLDRRVWQPVHKIEITDKKLIIPSKLFLKEKYNAEGTFEKLKARLVAGGHREDRSVFSSNEITSPTIATQSIFTIAAIAAHEGRDVITGDVPGAYLHADMKGDLFMILPKELVTVLIEMDENYKKYVTFHGTIYVKLLKALYGCVESARLWYEYLRARLEQIGFNANKVDPCVFNCGEIDNQLTIGVYVDDLIVTSKDKSAIEATINQINNFFDNISWNTGDKHNYLGMTFVFNKEKKNVTISMMKYVQDLLIKLDIKGTSKTPAGVNLFDINNLSQELGSVDKEKFHSTVASLLYLAKRVRPDLLLAISYLSTRISAPTEDDNKKLIKLMKYLNHTKHFHITIDGTELLTPWISIDASYGIHGDRKSHTGVVVGVGGGGVLHKSFKQKVVAKSSTEAEILATSDGISSAIYLRQFLRAQGYNLHPTKVYQDNLSTIQMLNNGGSSSERTRHIDIRHYWVTDQINLGEIVLEHVNSENMISDILTKPLSGKQFEKLRNKLLNWNSSSGL